MHAVWSKIAGSGLQILGSILLIVVVSVAAVLLYRWTDRVKDADRMRQKEFLEVAFRGFQSEFGGAIQEIHSIFRPVETFRNENELETHVSENYAQWQNISRQPQLIGGLGIGTIASRGPLVFKRYVPQEKKFQRQDWPAELQTYRDILTQRLSQQVPSTAPINADELSVSAEHPVIIIPVTFFRSVFPPFRSNGPGQPPAAGTPPENRSRRLPPSDQNNSAFAPRSQRLRRIPDERFPSVAGWYLIELDMHFLKQQFLPNLVERHFGGPNLSLYRLAVVAGKPRQLIYVSEQGLNLQSFDVVDMAAPLFRPQGRFGFGFRFRGGVAPPPEGAPGEMPPEPRSSFSRVTREGGISASGNAWQLLAKHRWGSIDVEVNKTRSRNLALGFGILLLMTGSIITLMLSAYKARALARQQMEFVAGVSHELRTPLSVIQSAGFNLARGVAVQTEKVQQYGTIIQTEGRRLSDMVERILSYAGIESGREHYQFKPVEIGSFMRNLLAEYKQSFEETGWTIEFHIKENLPPVWADARALESGVRNLVDNALKYASAGKWLGVSVAAAHHRSEVLVKVEDHGPGIASEDLPHIFEPFYRGKKIIASSVPGAGLGLSLLQRYLKAHGGRVNVENKPGGGASFTLHLPMRSESGQSGIA